MEEVIHSDVEFQAGQPGAGGVLAADTGSVGPRVFAQVIFQDTAVCVRAFFYKCPVVFPESGFLGIGELSGKFSGGGFGLGEYQDTGDRLIQSVDHSQIGLFAGGGGISRGGAAKVIFDQPFHIGNRYGAGLGGDAVGLDTDDDLVVFI